MLKAEKDQEAIYMGNTMYFDTKSSQFKLTIVKRKKILLKELMVNRLQKNRWRGQQVCDEMTQTYVKSEY